MPSNERGVQKTRAIRIAGKARQGTDCSRLSIQRHLPRVPMIRLNVATRRFSQSTSMNITRTLSSALLAAAVVACSGGVPNEPAADDRSIVTPTDDGTPSIPSNWTTTAAPDLGVAGASQAILRAWEDTRQGLPPLKIASRDSLTQLEGLFLASGANWYDTGGSLPGIPLRVELYRSGSVSSVMAAINVQHGKGGYFVAYRAGGGYTARAVSADEFNTFMALFGMSTIIVQ
jgi:hypothetical protein